MSEKLTELLGLLDLEQIDNSIFRASHPPSRTKRLFGGQIMAQALMAAIRTVDPERFAHSLHGYFLRPGDPSVAAIIRVERTRDGVRFLRAGCWSLSAVKLFLAWMRRFNFSKMGLVINCRCRISVRHNRKNSARAHGRSLCYVAT